jgi:hypothetical protein
MCHAMGHGHQFREPFQLHHARPQVLWREVRVAHGHFQIGMAENLLEAVQGATAHHEVTGEGMPEVMEPEVGDTGSDERSGKRRPDLSPGGAPTATEY